MCLDDCGNMHDCWKGVIGRLTHIDMVVGVDLLVSKLASEDLDGSICDDFVAIHV